MGRRSPHLLRGVAKLLAVALCAGVAGAQEAPMGSPEADPLPSPPPVHRGGAPVADLPPASAQDDAAARPFGANLFGGNFAAQRESGLNRDYRILPGDRIAVNAWGAVTLTGVFVVDVQGNIFLPGIGPVSLGGVANAELSDHVRRAIGRVYRGRYEVYTNLLTASPVAVFVTGAVVRPGRYAGTPSDSVLFFLDQAGGIDAATGSYRRVRVLRGSQQLAELDLYDFLVRGTLPSPQLADGDAILVERRGATVEVLGAVTHPALVELTAGGLTGAEVVSVVAPLAAANEVTLEGSRGARPVVRTMSLDAFSHAAVADGDTVTFRADHRAEHIVVRLEGEFAGPSALSVRRGSRLLDVLNYVPVNPELANTDAAHIKRRRVADEQRRSISDGLDRLERSALLALSGTQGEANIRVREAELVRQFVERARTIQPLGRVVTRSENRQLNVLLEDQDVVVIPQRTNVVRVGGEVQSTQALMYRPEMTAWDYIEQAGGYSDRGDSSKVILLSQSAEVRIADPGEPVRPGDEILVPPKVDTKAFQNALDLSSIIYQIAVAASVLIRL